MPKKQQGMEWGMELPDARWDFITALILCTTVVTYINRKCGNYNTNQQKQGRFSHNSCYVSHNRKSV